MRPSIERANEQLDPRQQLAYTPPPQSTTPGLHPVSIHQMAPPLLIYRKDERLSWPSWLTCSGRFTHIVVTSRLQAERRTGSVRRLIWKLVVDFPLVIIEGFSLGVTTDLYERISIGSRRYRRGWVTLVQNFRQKRTAYQPFVHG